MRNELFGKSSIWKVVIKQAVKNAKNPGRCVGILIFQEWDLV